MSKPGGPGEAQEGPVDDFFVRVQDEYVALFWLRNRFCEYDKKKCGAFQPTFSTKGLSYTFNSGDMWSLYKRTEEIEAMHKGIFYYDEENVSPWDRANNSDVQRASRRKRLMFHLRQSFLDVLMNSKSPFWIAVHSPLDIATDFIKLSPGYRQVMTE